MPKKPKGWVKEPVRHGLAGRGVKTGSKEKRSFDVSWYVPQEGYEQEGTTVEARDEAEAREIVMKYLKDQYPLPEGMAEEPEIFDSSTESFYENIKKKEIHVAKETS